MESGTLGLLFTAKSTSMEECLELKVVLLLVYLFQIGWSSKVHFSVYVSFSLFESLFVPSDIWHTSHEHAWCRASVGWQAFSASAYATEQVQQVQALVFFKGNSSTRFNPLIDLEMYMLSFCSMKKSKNIKIILGT